MSRKSELEEYFTPVQPRVESRFSENAMREIHEGRAQYAPPPKAAPQRAQRYRRPVQPQPVEDEDEEEEDEEEADVKPRKKKHRFLRFLLKLVFFVLLLAALAGGGLLLLAKMPRSTQPIGTRKDGCATILLAGTDMGGERTDTIMLLFLDTEEQTMRLLSIPRDTMVNRDNPVPKINGAYGANGSGAKGMDALMGYTADLIGYRPDGYMLIDLACFEELVDAMGGVTYDVPMDMQYEDPVQDLVIDLRQGRQHLNGEQSMWLVRFRSGYAAADLERVNVQRDFLSAAMKQWVSVWKLPRLPFAAKLVWENTTSDLDLLEMAWVAKAVVLCRGHLENDTLPGYGDMVNGGSYYIESIYDAAALLDARYNPYQTAIVAESLHPYGR